MGTFTYFLLEKYRVPNNKSQYYGTVYF